VSLGNYLPKRSASESSRRCPHRCAEVAAVGCCNSIKTITINLKQRELQRRCWSDLIQAAELHCEGMQASHTFDQSISLSLSGQSGWSSLVYGARGSPLQQLKRDYSITINT
jgi:hypothetical protein